MRRFGIRQAGLFFVLLVASVLPRGASAALLGKPIIPQSGVCYCDKVFFAYDWGCVLQIFQNVLNTAVVLAIILSVFWIAYAGFSMMTSGSSAEARSIARTRLLNIVVGVAVILTAWVSVDFVMKAIYNPDTVFKATVFGPWNEILASEGNNYCITMTVPNPIATGVVDVLHTALSTVGVGNGTTGGGNATGSCDPTQVQAAAQTGGYTLTTQQATILACLAQPESRCGANTTGATQRNGTPTSAAGPWQNLLGASDKCHSLNIPACGNLNCSAAYSGGHVKSDPASQALAQQCQAEMNNLTCAASAAACLVQANNGFSAWTGTGDGYSHSTQKSCVNSNGG